METYVEPYVESLAWWVLWALSDLGSGVGLKIDAAAEASA